MFPVLENSTLHLWYFSIKEAPLKVFSNLILNIAIHPETWLSVELKSANNYLNLTNSSSWTSAFDKMEI